MTRATAMAAMVAGLMGLAAPGCEGGAERARGAGAEVQREAGALAERTRTGAEALMAAAGERTRAGAGELMAAASERTAEATQAAGAWAGELVRGGQLSAAARDWLRRGAAASRGGIEALLQRGEQAVPVALEIGQALASAVDRDTMFEPIYQEVSGASPELAVRRAEADAVIQGMPRVEVIDGLQVGFKDLSTLDMGRQVSEQAYLVVWRQDDHLIGFIYRSRRSVALAQLVALAPRLIGLVRSAL